MNNVQVVLVEPGTPGNIGATARVLKTTGIERLTLVKPGNWDTIEARRFAHGSGDILDNCRICPDLATAVAECHTVVGTTHRVGNSAMLSPPQTPLSANWRTSFTIPK